MAEIGQNAGTHGAAAKVVKWLCAAVVLVVAAGTFAGARGCESARVTRELRDGERVPVVVAGETFSMEPALDDASRVRGLGGRAVIEPKGGMVFVFPQPHRMEFLMRDCLADIDIAFLDDGGRVLAMHAMKAEPPRTADEPVRDFPNDQYENRLKRYSSRFPCRVAVEFAGGTLARLGVKEGDKVTIDLAPLKARVR